MKLREIAQSERLSASEVMRRAFDLYVSQMTAKGSITPTGRRDYSYLVDANDQITIVSKITLP